MAKLLVTFLWHHHQPYYRDPVTGHFALPWVRLHGIKDYIGMARLLAEFPSLKQGVNFVPSLLRQIDEYHTGATDTAMILARTPADSLSAKQAAELLNTFFTANRRRMIDPHPRYRQLFAKRDFAHKTGDEAARTFSVPELRDLQVWGNLAWCHPTVLEQDDELLGLVRRGREFTEEDKRYVLDRQREILAEIVPLHRKLAESGQLELTTSPFYHPVVPLLCDHQQALSDEPDLARPAAMPHAPEDAAAQIERALAHHEHKFGARPRGMWPSEGAVSDDALALFAAAGVGWVATDEDLLARTLGITFPRGPDGAVEQPETLYAPYRFTCDAGEVVVVFRDQVLSDLIGFREHLRDPLEAAQDLMARLEATRRRAPDNALVLIALDGENCWEHYPRQGVDFVRHFYRLLSEAPDIETVRIRDYLAEFGAGRQLAHVSPGSWISGSFASWVGHWEKNRGWESLARARNFYAARVAEGVQPDRAAEALDNLYIAEGSDWFWWYGEDHATGGDAEFDSLFRRRLRRIYELLGARPPDELLRPITDQVVRESIEPPRRMIDVQVDGRPTSFFEWLGAGTCTQTRGAGARQRSELVPATALQFGLGPDSLFLRLDLAEIPRQSGELTVELWLEGRAEPAAVIRFDPDGGAAVADPAVHAAQGRIIEIGVPLETLGLRRGQDAPFFVRLLQSGSAVQRFPASGSIPLAVPADPDTAYAGGEDLV